MLLQASIMVMIHLFLGSMLVENKARHPVSVQAFTETDFHCVVLYGRACLPPTVSTVWHPE